MLVLSPALFDQLRRPTNCSKRSAASELSAGPHQVGYRKAFLKAIPACINSANVSKQEGSSMFIEEQLDRNRGHLSQVNPQYVALATRLCIVGPASPSPHVSGKLPSRQKAKDSRMAEFLYRLSVNVIAQVREGGSQLSGLRGPASYSFRQIGRCGRHCVSVSVPLKVRPAGPIPAETKPLAVLQYAPCRQGIHCPPNPIFASVVMENHMLEIWKVSQRVVCV